MHPSSPYQDKLSPWSSHRVIAALLADLPPGARVLDVGAASGTLARLCAGRGFVLRGIEPAAEWIEAARPLYTELFTGGLEAAPEAFLQGQAAVVCGDVLEHLPQPEQALRRLAALQGAGCRFIISVPNVANLWVRLHLLGGNFDYAERGILDRTHLRFYTRKTFLGLLEAAGLSVQTLRATPVPLDLIHPFFTQKTAGRALFGALARVTGWRPTLLGYQWVALAVKR